MASTKIADSVNALRVVTSGPWPTIRPDRIGTIGSTQGVNASSSPMPKNTASTAGRAPPVISAARRSDSETGPAGAPRSLPAGRVAGAATGTAGASDASATFHVVGG